ncbi:hypothetical protein [Clostridium hydrogeniformans]|uniref:hypothetical protein n=1 Tax=Clostridium hydrogeniformans TaxID=349933 RepID=UPI0004807527|nr:hypothetical protein [Clostridium hydrogeniformans]
MKNNKTKVYLPKERDYLEQEPRNLRSYSKDRKTYSRMPDNVTDDVVVNNIAYQEFDYTHVMEELED